MISPSALIPTNTETFLAYYDIFVRNVFGSYRDVLREVAYSPMMAEMLTNQTLQSISGTKMAPSSMLMKSLLGKFHNSLSSDLWS